MATLSSGGQYQNQPWLAPVSPLSMPHRVILDARQGRGGELEQPLPKPDPGCATAATIERPGVQMVQPLTIPVNGRHPYRHFYRATQRNNPDNATIPMIGKATHSIKSPFS
jgi:hypothetical protein